MGYNVRHVQFRRMVYVAAGLGVMVVGLFAYKTYFGVAPWEHRPGPLPKIDHASAISPREVTVVDGDTIKARGRTIRLVGFDTETLDGTLKQMMSGQLTNPPLPLDDFNRRIVLFGVDAAQVLGLANAMSKRPWHNVAYFSGSYSELAAAFQK